MYILILCLAICLDVPAWFYAVWSVVLLCKFLIYCEKTYG